MEKKSKRTKQRFIVGLHSWQKEQLAQVSDITGVPIAELIRQSVEYWLHEHSKSIVNAAIENRKFMGRTAGE